MNTMVLVGAEQVQSAGYSMREAASDMSRSISNLESIFSQHHRFMDDWLMRFENAMEGKKP